jgi:hypothetical protein
MTPSDLANTGVVAGTALAVFVIVRQGLELWSYRRAAAYWFNETVAAECLATKLMREAAEARAEAAPFKRKKDPETGRFAKQSEAA